MTLLLDTHTALWLALGDSNLSAAALAAIQHPANECRVSDVSFWEIAIKVSRGKLVFRDGFPEGFEAALLQEGIHRLAPDLADYHELAWLPFLPAESTGGREHKDPFDRMLVAQTRAKRWTPVSRDSVLDGYGIQRLW